MQATPAPTRQQRRGQAAQGHALAGFGPTRVMVTGSRPMISEAGATPAICTETARPT